MVLRPWCVLALFGPVLSDVSVDLPASDCQVGDECSEESALLQQSWRPQQQQESWHPQQQHQQCKPIKHSCKSRKVAGYLYTALNGEDENKVVVFNRRHDGSLGKQRVYGTGSKGGSNTSRSGALRGDYDAQYGMVIIGEYLLVVNGGGNTVSTFLMCHDGSLKHMGNVPSGGERPTSIAFVPKGGKKDKQQYHKPVGNEEYWVVVGNQWSSPVILGDRESGNIQYYPNESYHVDNLYANQNPQLNIFLFSFDAAKGQLSPEHLIESYEGTWGGPSAVAFNSAGTKLGLTTWGIAHDAVAEQNQKLFMQHPSRLYVYDFDGLSGEFSNKRWFESCGDAGYVGFSWHPHSDRIYVASFNSVNAKGLKVFSDSGKAVRLDQEFEGDKESCWTKLHPSLKWIYIANFEANTITQFELDAEGVVQTQVDNVPRENVMPPGDTKEMLIDSAAKNFYIQGTGFSFVIGWYSMDDSGKLSLNKEVKVRELIGAVNYTSNLLGIEGFEYCPQSMKD